MSKLAAAVKRNACTAINFLKEYHNPIIGIGAAAYSTADSIASFDPVSSDPNHLPNCFMQGTLLAIGVGLTSMFLAYGIKETLVSKSMYEGYSDTARRLQKGACALAFGMALAGINYFNQTIKNDIVYDIQEYKTQYVANREAREIADKRAKNSPAKKSENRAKKVARQRDEAERKSYPGRFIMGIRAPF